MSCSYGTGVGVSVAATVETMTKVDVGRAMEVSSAGLSLGALVPLRKSKVPAALKSTQASIAKPARIPICWIVIPKYLRSCVMMPLRYFYNDFEECYPVLFSLTVITS